MLSLRPARPALHPAFRRPCLPGVADADPAGIAGAVWGAAGRGERSRGRTLRTDRVRQCRAAGHKVRKTGHPIHWLPPPPPPPLPTHRPHAPSLLLRPFYHHPDHSRSCLYPSRPSPNRLPTPRRNSQTMTCVCVCVCTNESGWCYV